MSVLYNIVNLINGCTVHSILFGLDCYMYLTINDFLGPNKSQIHSEQI